MALRKYEVDAIVADIQGKLKAKRDTAVELYKSSSEFEGKMAALTNSEEFKAAVEYFKLKLELSEMENKAKALNKAAGDFINGTYFTVTNQEQLNYHLNTVHETAIRKIITEKVPILPNDNVIENKIIMGSITDGGIPELIASLIEEFGGNY